MIAKRISGAEPSVHAGGRAGRRVGLLVAFLGILLGGSTSLRAQGVRYDNIVLGPRGGPVASATVAVCSAGATTSTTPCSPLATIYSDESLKQPMANPFQADSLGNYGFWATPGHYILQISGNGVATRVMNVFLPCDPSNCSMSNATFSSITAGTLNLTGGLTVNGRSVATQPKAGDAVMFVSPNGSDSNAGLSWGTAKQTLYGAVQAISAQASNSGWQDGTIYVADNVSCGGPVSGQGLMLYAAGSSPGTGWLHVPSALRIVGVGTTHWGNNGTQGVVALNCGDATHPGLELDNFNIPIHFANLAFGGSVGANLVGGVTTASFDNVVFTADNSSATNGPAVLIGYGSFWDYFNHCIFQANDNPSKPTDGSDSAEAVVVNVDPSGGQTTNLIFIHNSVARNGDIKFNSTSTTSAGQGLVVDGLTTENQSDGKGAVWVKYVTGTDSFYLANIGVADATVNPTPAVEVDGGEPEGTVAVSANGYGLNTVGPMMLNGQYPNNVQNETEIPYQKGQLGIISGKLWAQDDSARRLFPPQASRFANIVPYSGTQWSTNSGTPTPAAVAAPDGTNNATQITGGSSGSSITAYTSETSSNGDYYIGGMWVRNATGSGGYPGNSAFYVQTGCSGTFTSLTPNPSGYIGGAWQTGTTGEWEFWSFAMKMTGLTGATTCYPAIVFVANANQTMQMFAPVAYYVPAGTISDAEASYLAMTIGSYPNGITPPVEATLRGHPFAFGGSGDNYFAILDHTGLTANRTFTFPDSSGTLCTTATCGGPLTGTVSYASQSIPANSCASATSISVSGVITSMVVVASPQSDPGGGILWQAWPTGTGTLAVRECNLTTASISVPAVTYNVRVIQ